MRFLLPGVVLLIAVVARAQDLSAVRQSGAPVASIGMGKQAGIVTVKGRFTKGQHAVIVRLDDDDDEYEVIADGKVIAVNGGVATVKMDDDRLKKLPDMGDFVVPLGDPKVFQPPKPAPKMKDVGFELETSPKPEAGYILFGVTNSTSNFKSEGSDSTNSLKQMPKFPLNGFRLDWFLEFLPSYGISYAQASSTVPITSYYRNDVTADVSEMNFRVMYRTERHSYFRFTGYLTTKVFDFKTNNPDALVVATQINTTGLGADFDFEYGDLLLRAPGTKFQFTSLRLEYNMLAGGATDGLASRGTGSVTETELHLIGTVQAWLPWVPYVKRYFLSVDSFLRDRKLAFSGTTRNDTGDRYIIPEGGTYSEKETGLLISFGVRFDDIVGRVFKPKE